MPYVFPDNTRVIVEFENTPVGARIVPHNTDDDQLMLKSSTREGARMLANLAGIQPGPVTQGDHYFMCAVPKADFLEGLAAAIAIVLEASASTAKTSPR